MEIYILRHAIAVPRGSKEYPNDDRPLTKKGIQKMKSASRGIARLLPKIDVILTSPLLRASDTAKIVAKALKWKEKVNTCDELLPGTDLTNALNRLEKYTEKKRVLIVGHEPDLGSLASVLLGSKSPILQFKKGSLCRIDVSSFPLTDHGTLIWHLTPKQLRALT